MLITPETHWRTKVNLTGTRMVKKALVEFQTRAKSRLVITGVFDVEEHHRLVRNGSRPCAGYAEAMLEIKMRFGACITEENYWRIIAAVHDATEALVIPVNDMRLTYWAAMAHEVRKYRV